jgi:hypothetical protein
MRPLGDNRSLTVVYTDLRWEVRTYPSAVETGILAHIVYRSHCYCLWCYWLPRPLYRQPTRYVGNELILGTCN